MADTPEYLQNIRPEDRAAYEQAILSRFGYQRNGMPARPDYHPTYDPWNMSLATEAGGTLSGINADKRGMDAFRQEALRKGPSQWSAMAKQAQDRELGMNRDTARREAGGTAADARAQLAMRGGINSGARERVAKSGQKNYLDMSRQLGAQTMDNKSQIDMNDEKNRIQQLGMLPGMENQALQPELQKATMGLGARQFDIQQQTQEGLAHNAFDLQKYAEQMRAWGANRQADATAAAGKK
jgi:hypothetical protein